MGNFSLLNGQSQQAKCADKEVGQKTGDDIVEENCARGPALKGEGACDHLFEVRKHPNAVIARATTVRNGSRATDRVRWLADTRATCCYAAVMANGGWYGTPEEWQRLEGPLLTIDPVLESFATRHGLALSKNTKKSPERSLYWGDNPSFLIQVFLESETGPSWNLWLCCSEDRSDSRYWRKDFAVRGELIDSFREGLPSLLEECFNQLEAWGANLDQLEFATKLAPMPPL